MSTIIQLILGIWIWTLAFGRFTFALPACDHPEWTEFEGHCYHMFRYPEPLTGSVPKARMVCKEFGADLVAIKSQREQEFIYELLKSDGPYVTEAYIGLSDSILEDNFTWLDGSTVKDINYTHWKIGNPNNYDHGFLNGENCATIVQSTWDLQYGVWNDVPCLFNPRFIDGVICETHTKKISGINMGYKGRMIRGMYLMNYVLEESSERNMFTCYLNCVLHPECLSINYMPDTTTENNCLFNNLTRYETRDVIVNTVVDGIDASQWVYVEVFVPSV